jgi:hypothetical protein
MALDPRTRAELERRGVASVRALLNNREAAGIGSGAEVRLGVSGVPNGSRAEIEAWCCEKELAASRRDTRRFWLGAILGIVTIIVAVIFGVLTLPH